MLLPKVISAQYLTVYAVDVPTLGVRGDSWQDLEEALETHTLGSAKLMGKYGRRR